MNIIKHSDSYKWSHYLQYPKDVKFVSSYIEARKINKEEIDTDKIVFFGLQAYVKKYLMPEADCSFKRQDIELADKVSKLHGVPFNKSGWEYILQEHGGRLPVLIQAIPEGSVVPAKTPLVQIRNTDPKVPWLTSFIETSLLRAIWYPTTVATLSYSVRQTMKPFWQETVDDDRQEGLNFALHDFGARGVSSSESAELGGMAHLLSFNGTDTIEALYAADKYYHEAHIDPKHRSYHDAPFEENYVAGYSVPAAEHSTITSWGKEGEFDAYSNMIEQFGGDGKIYSVVSDSYDIFNAVEKLSSGEMLEKIQKKGGRFVIRPDSGDPKTVIGTILSILEGNLEDYISINKKGYKVLPDYFRIIQGDGCSEKMIVEILQLLMDDGWSAENIVFGMGGGLLQKVNRDTLSFAMKCNGISRYESPYEDDHDWEPVFKKPVSDPAKASRAGRIFDIENNLGVVYASGLRFRYESFSTLKKRVQEA